MSQTPPTVFRLSLILQSQHLCSAYQTVPCTNQSISSNDSCSSGIGSQSSQQWADLELQGQPQGQWSGSVLGVARVHSNYSPSADEKDFLQLRVSVKYLLACFAISYLDHSIFKRLVLFFIIYPKTSIFYVIWFFDA